jgi:hypothetical protein
MMTGKGITIEKSYSFVCYFFGGIHIVTTGKVFYFCLGYKREPCISIALSQTNTVVKDLCYHIDLQ